MYKKLLISALMLLSLNANDLTINITNVLNANGIIHVGVYNSKSTFKIVGQEMVGVKLEAKRGDTTYTFKDLDNGVYAVSIFHDENKNSTLDKNFLGIPSEGYGFSNNIRPIFRGANFEESKFKFYKDTKLNIKVGY